MKIGWTIPKTERRTGDDVTLEHNRLVRPLTLVGLAGTIATTLALIFGAGVSLAKQYEDNNLNLCDGLFCEVWEANVTGSGNAAFGSASMQRLKSGNANVALGADMMPYLTTGSFNVAIDEGALFSNNTGESDIAIGFHALYTNGPGSEDVALGHSALFSNTTGHGDIASGSGALKFNTVGTNNIATGSNALEKNETGSFNVASGYGALVNATGGSNIALGGNAGGNLTTGSNNIDIANAGVGSESGSTRIGTEGTQAKAFVAGVAKTAVKGCSVQVTSEGQLGCNNNPAGSAVATYASTKAVASGSCLDFTGRGAPGTLACPAATSGYSASRTLSLAMPANGATVSNLYAATNATLSGSDTAVVEIIDNPTSAVLLACTVNSTNQNTCSNNGSTAAAAAGDKLEVRITATGTSGTGKAWEVTFRY